MPSQLGLLLSPPHQSLGPEPELALEFSGPLVEPQTSLSAEQWTFTIQTLPRHQALGLGPEGLAALPSRESSVGEAAGATWRRSAPPSTSARPTRSRRSWVRGLEGKAGGCGWEVPSLA